MFPREHHTRVDKCIHCINKYDITHKSLENAMFSRLFAIPLLLMLLFSGVISYTCVSADFQFAAYAFAARIPSSL